MAMITNGICAPTSHLRQIIESAATESGRPMRDFTVLSPQVDPFRIDTPARHRDGEWLAAAAATLGLSDRKIHLRGLHYMVAMSPEPMHKPDGSRYVNDDLNWGWLESAAKAARWLGYIPFDQIFDKRNDAPVVRVTEEREPWHHTQLGLDLEIPTRADIDPRVDLHDFVGIQPYRIVLAGEKSSLEDVLLPVAERHAADLYLPTGEMSDTMIHRIARCGDEDGRPLVVLYFADCDPAGWQMPLSVSRKLQAFKTSLFPDLDFEVHRVALTPDLVREYDLPSAPLKETERRGDRWREAMRVDQTEIDALTSLRPDLLRHLAEDAIAPHYDHTLERRVHDARAQWVSEAQAALDEATDHALVEQLRGEAELKLAEMQEEVDRINDALRIDAAPWLPPVPPVPDAAAAGGQPMPLVNSRWSFADQCAALIASKAYR